MKPAAFEYARPASLDEACAMLAQGDDARIIAGGQTLVPLMAMRLARPKRLIDIARMGELAFIRNEGDVIAIGATTRQCVLERDPVIAAELPLLAKAMPFVGHAATRARGTIGGSLANADPAAEIALVAVTLGATLVYRDGHTSAVLPAVDFFVGPMTTALPPTACLTAVHFPLWREARRAGERSERPARPLHASARRTLASTGLVGARIGTGFHEVSARASDFAFAAAAAQLALDDAGVCRRLAVGIGAVTMTPLLLDGVSRALVGTRLEEHAVRAAVTEALAGIAPMADLHASADYRRRAAASLAVRAITDAYRAAASGGRHAR